MTDDPISAAGSEAAANQVAIPILVGVVGKRNERLANLGVSEALVRQKLQAAFDLLEKLTPSSPKLLLCGMADGVDEIAARVVIGTAGEAKRRFTNWSVVGLLPLPEHVFVEDFASDQGQPWWYHTLDDGQRRLVRVIPLQTLPKPGTLSPDGSPALYTADELRRIDGQSTPARDAHYEQLALVLADRSTVFIAVMPEDEVPSRLGGTAQAVAHRLNGWRPDWPPANSDAVAEISNEFVMPPPLAQAMSGDVWLAPIGPNSHDTDPFDFRILQRREETQSVWPNPAEGMHGGGAHPARAIGRALMPPRPAAQFMRSVSRTGGGRVARAIDAFNRRIAVVGSRQPPQWDRSIAENPALPAKWSAIAAAERIRGTLSDVQVDSKKRVRNAAICLGLFAWLSILFLEIDLEVHSALGVLKYVGIALPSLYVISVLLIVVVLYRVHQHAWDAIAEDYRMVAEALRVQIVWWQFGLIARKDWVDQHMLRYDAREFQLVRQTVASFLESLRLQCAPLAAVAPAERLPDGVNHWIGAAEPSLSGQIGYQKKTAKSRRNTYEWLEFAVWMSFGIACALAILLVIHATHEAFGAHLFEKLADIIGWPIAVGLFAVGIASFVWVACERFEGSSQGNTFRRIWHSLWPGIFLAAGFLMAWYDKGWSHDKLHQVLGVGALLGLAAAGTIKYAAEKMDVEAEAQNAAEASVIYARARRLLDQIDREVDAQVIDLAEANRRREPVIRGLGLYALAETEAWLRSHRERPLHPPIG